MEPRAEQISFPEGYGTPTTLLKWEDVRTRLETAERYWVATTRPDGRPHVVPVDGVWHEDRFYWGGAPATVHQRNLKTNPEVAVHLESGVQVVIAEGRVEWAELSAEESARLARVSNDKYSYGIPDDAYVSGAWRLRPNRVIAWDTLFDDATRFRF